MNIPSLNFDCDYNHKLSCDYFTSIRSIHTYFEKNLFLGCEISVHLGRKFQFNATVVDVEVLDLDNLSLSQRQLVSHDTGKDSPEAIRFLKALLGSSEVVVIYIKKNL